MTGSLVRHSQLVEVTPSQDDPAVRRTVLSAPDWDAALGAGWPARIMAERIDDRFHAKQGRSISRWAVPGGPVVYLKRHYILPRSLAFFAGLFPGRHWTPGMQEADRLRWVARQGIFVPRVVAAGEFLSKGKLQSFLAVEELHGMRALNEALPVAQANYSPSEFVRFKRGLVGEVARLSRELHRRRIFHKDLYLCHFFVHDADLATIPDDWTGRVAMIDFHRVGRYPWFWAKWQAKDLAQLLYSTFDVPGITARDRVRFWKRYREADWQGVTPPPRVVHYVAAVKAGRYYRHNQKLQAAAAKGGER